MGVTYSSHLRGNKIAVSIRKSLDSEELRRIAFSTSYRHDAVMIVQFLEKEVGAGSLYDEAKEDCPVVHDAERPLTPGQYKYILKSMKPQGQPASMLYDPVLRCVAGQPASMVYDPVLQSNSAISDDFMEERPRYALRPVTKATEADLEEALGYLDFEFEDGHAYGLKDKSFKLPEPVEGTKCSAFDPTKGGTFDKALSDYHKECLGQMEVPMGKDGFNVLKLTHMRSAVDVLIGAKRYVGSVDSGAVPGIITDLSASHYIRVGFVHLHCNKASLSAGSEGNSLDDQQPQLIISMLGVMFKTEVPLDFVSTDGVIYNLYRFHEKKLLKYARLPAEKAYFALADRLKKKMEVKATAEYLTQDPTKDVLKEFPEEETMAHRIVKKMLPHQL